jgi:acetate kinase
VNILVINVGSTSLKFKLYNMPVEQLIAEGGIDRIGEPVSTVNFTIDGVKLNPYLRQVVNHEEAVSLVVDVLEKQNEKSVGIAGRLSFTPDAVGFKTVHAGSEFGPVLIDQLIIGRMEEFSGAAPSHNPAYIKAIRSFQIRTPDLPLVAVFETGFHRHIPDYAYMYSTPYDWYEQWGIRKYGFHGASLKFVSDRVRELTDGNSSKVILCHLGGSSSICAVLDGISLDTSMGFSPQAGILMNNRIGDIDPFILPCVKSKSGMDMESLFTRLITDSGLKGISGYSGDVRDLERDHETVYRADLALNMFSYAVKKYIGAYAAVLDGVDALCFSGGIGEKSSYLRNAICSGMGYLGIELDKKVNSECFAEEQRISSPTSKVDIFVIPTNEEIVVARSTWNILKIGDHK